MSSLISNNVKKIEISGIRKFYNKVREVPGAISLTLGEPDFNVPTEVKEAIKKAIDEDKTRYTSNEGLIELREEISAMLSKKGVNYSADEICVTVGGSEAIMAVMAAVINSGDKILVPSIAYPAYENCAKIMGAEVITYKLKDDFSIDFNNLEEVIAESKPKLMVLSYPSNPTGKILTKDQCDKLHDIIKTSSVLVLSDEMYSSIIFDEYNSICSYDDIKAKVIMINGFSKMFSMTGIRIGYICAKKSILRECVKVHQYNVSCAPSIGQYGALEGLRKCQYHIDKVRDEYVKRRDYTCNRLKDMGMDVNTPQGAFYVFPSIKKFNMTSEEFCTKLLYCKKVAIVPGSAFGEGGEGYVRISYSYNMETLKTALDSIESFVKEL